MSRFQEKSETIYVGYDPGDLNNYLAAVNTDTDLNCSANGAKYNSINNGFNPAIVPTFKQGDKITPSAPFFGPNGLSLNLDIYGNLSLQQTSKNLVIGNLWSTGCNSSDALSDSKFTLQEPYRCSNGNIIDSTTNKNILNPYCKLDTSGNLVCYGCTIASGKSIPYMTFGNKSSDINSKLIINGNLTLNGGSDNNIIGNLTILDSNNKIINTSIKPADKVLLTDLPTNFMKTEQCKNAYSAQELIAQYDDHIAATQMMGDSEVAYDVQYTNLINLTLGICITLGYIYYLYKKK